MPSDLIPKLIAISDCRRQDRRVPGTRVLLDGKDISADCFYAETYRDGTGRVGCYLRDVSGRPGHFYVEPSDQPGSTPEIAKNFYLGRVEIIKPATVTAEEWRTLQEQWVANV